MFTQFHNVAAGQAGEFEVVHLPFWRWISAQWVAIRHNLPETAAKLNMKIKGITGSCRWLLPRMMGNQWWTSSGNCPGRC
jgi:hypothetical protein